MKFELTASMMCADYGHLEQEVKNLEEAGIDSFHVGRRIEGDANDELFFQPLSN